MWNLLLPIQFEEDTIFYFCLLNGLIEYFHFPAALQGFFWSQNSGSPRLHGWYPGIRLPGADNYFIFIYCTQAGSSGARRVERKN